MLKQNKFTIYSQFLSFTSSLMKNIFGPQSTFSSKIIAALLLDQQQVIVVYLDLLLSQWTHLYVESLSIFHLLCLTVITVTLCNNT